MKIGEESQALTERTWVVQLQNEDKEGRPVGLGKGEAQGKWKIYLNYSHPYIKVCISCIILEV